MTTPLDNPNRTTVVASDRSYLYNLLKRTPAQPGRYVAPPLDVRFKVIKVFDGTDTGFKGLFYKNDTQDEIVVAISAMDAEVLPDTAQALKSAWLMWNTGKENVLGSIKTLKDSDTGWAFDAATTQVNFAGQSLGGALAGYAAFDFWRDNKVNNPDIVSRITLTTFDGLAGVAEMAALGDATVPLRSASQ